MNQLIKRINGLLPSNKNDYRNLIFLVIGYGISGKAIIEVLNKLEATTYLYDKNLIDSQIKISDIVLVSNEIEKKSFWNEIDFVITSPGVLPSEFVIQLAVQHGKPVMGEVEFAWQLDKNEIFGSKHKWCAITGTNGKTTTTAIINELLNNSGKLAVACGNIGKPVSQIVAQRAKVFDYLVVELSSFQLYWSDTIKPDYSVLLNLNEDHIDFHGSMENYINTKSKILVADTIIFGLDDEVVRDIYINIERKTFHSIYGFTSKTPAAQQVGIESDWIISKIGSNKKKIIQFSKLPDTNYGLLQNILATVTLASVLDLPERAIERTLTNLEIGSHRMQYVAKYKNIDIIDDSKATNPHATQTAFLNYKYVIWLAGGLLKGANIELLVKNISNKLNFVILFGTDKLKYLNALMRYAPQVSVHIIFSNKKEYQEFNINRFQYREFLVNDFYTYEYIDHIAAAQKGKKILEQAIEKAFANLKLKPVEVILFSPAAASMDLFQNYVQRGSIFQSLIKHKIQQELN